MVLAVQENLGLTKYKYASYDAVAIQAMFTSEILGSDHEKGNVHILIVILTGNFGRC